MICRVGIALVSLPGRQGAIVKIHYRNHYDQYAAGTVEKTGLLKQLAPKDHAALVA